MIYTSLRILQIKLIYCNFTKNLFIMSYFDQKVRNINWSLLRKQKLWLLNQDTDEANGIIHLVDAVQDYAEKELGERGVFVRPFQEILEEEYPKYDSCEIIAEINDDWKVFHDEEEEPSGKTKMEAARDIMLNLSKVVNNMCQWSEDHTRSFIEECMSLVPLKIERIEHLVPIWHEAISSSMEMKASSRLIYSDEYYYWPTFVEEYWLQKIEIEQSLLQL